MDAVKLSRIGKEIIRRTTKVREIANILQESRLIWYTHTIRREVELVFKRLMVMGVPGNRRKVRAKRSWMDNIKEHFSEKGLSWKEAQVNEKAAIHQ